jgi:hypothetical protein
VRPAPTSRPGCGVGWRVPDAVGARRYRIVIAQTSYTAGQFAPGYIDDAGMNVIAVDAYD